MGLELDPEVAHEIAAALVGHAVETNNFVRIDMEGSALTQVTLDIVKSVHAGESPAGPNRGHIGVVIQAYLYRRRKRHLRSAQRRQSGSVLCQGRLPGAARDRLRRQGRCGLELRAADAAARQERSLQRYCDPRRRHDRSDQAVRPRTQDRAATEFEFQMLYGVRRDLQRSLIAEGYGVRVYIPFGHEWYPYFMRRLAERPANVLFLAKNFSRTSAAARTIIETAGSRFNRSSLWQRTHPGSQSRQPPRSLRPPKSIHPEFNPSSISE